MTPADRLARAASLVAARRRTPGGSPTMATIAQEPRAVPPPMPLPSPAAPRPCVAYDAPPTTIWPPDVPTLRQRLRARRRKEARLG